MATFKTKYYTVHTELDIPIDLSKVNRRKSESDFHDKRSYEIHLELESMFNDYHARVLAKHKQNNNIISEDETHTKKYYNVKEWLRDAKKLKLSITSSPMAGTLSKSAKIYYAGNESDTAGGYFYLYSPDNGEGSLEW
jgi:hypothetical protein